MAKKFKKPDIPDYYVIKDTREQHGYFFKLLLILVNKNMHL